MCKCTDSHFLCQQAFMRHTGQWVRLYDALTVDECLKAIQDDPWVVP